MASNIPASRRDGKNIVGNIRSQKPSAKVQIFRWSDPNEQNNVILQAGGNGSIENTLSGASSEYTIDNDIVRVTTHKNKNSSSGSFSFVLKRGNYNEGERAVNNNPLDYLQKINPGDWCAIWISNRETLTADQASRKLATNGGLKMLGIIENVRYVETDDPNTGKPRLEYIVTGRDYGKVLENEIFYNPLMQGLKLDQLIGLDFLRSNKTVSDGIQKEVSADLKSKILGNVQSKSPNAVLTFLFSYFLGGRGQTISTTTQPWLAPAPVQKLFGKSDNSKKTGTNVKVADVIDYTNLGILKYDDKGVVVKRKDLLGRLLIPQVPPDGNLFSLINHFMNPMLNEFLVDFIRKPNGTLYPAFIARQLPYSNKRSSKVVSDSGFKGEKAALESEKTYFTDLYTHKILSTDVKEKNVGKSEFERVNAILVTNNNQFLLGEQSQNITYKMVINNKSLIRYGLSLLSASTIYVNFGKNYDLYQTKALDLMTDWFFSSHLLYDGTIVADGQSEFVSIGDNLLIEDLGQLFQIEGISHYYELDQVGGGTSFSTEFRVSRGQKVDRGKASFIGDSNPKNSGKHITISTQALENIRNLGKNRK